MRHWIAGLISIIMVGLLGQNAVAQAVVKSDYSTASLISDVKGFAPGAEFHLALHMDLKNHWHTYWLNPGDAGLATQIQWQAPEGITFGDIEWPTPKAIRLGELMNYGYEGITNYPVAVHVATDFAETGPITIHGKAGWLVCESICIPETADLSITLNALPAGSANIPDSAGAKAIDATISALPKALPTDQLQAAFSFSDDKAKFSFAGPKAQELSGTDGPLYFYPEDSGAVLHPAPQLVSRGSAGFTIWADPGFRAKRGELKKTGGILTAGTGKNQQAYAINLIENGSPLADAGTNTPPSTAPAPTKSSGSLWQALLFAFVGGLILNLMPCVFPVLSLKVLGFANAAHEEQGEIRKHGILFGAGVLISFWALAGFLLALKAGGAGIGWGFQLQNAWFVGAMATLFFAIGLNLVGLFEIGGSWTSAGSSLADAQGALGAFFTGVLAVLVASPCTAPAMGAALGFTLGQSAIVTLAVFTALGVGFAAPFVLLSFFPGWLKALPKPGAWMGRFHQLLAFPMFAAALWLVWVMGGLGGMIAAFSMLLALLALAFAIWAWKGKMAGKVLALIGVIGFGMAFAHAAADNAPTTLQPIPWSAAKVAELQSENRIIFVDFTADWCLTCQVNKKTSLQTKAVAEAFAKHHVAYLEADWTKRDETIADELAKYGRAGVPLYLVYLPGDAKAHELPQLLTPKLVVDAVSSK